MKNYFFLAVSLRFAIFNGANKLLASGNCKSSSADLLRATILAIHTPTGSKYSAL
jgi:hypothetical protein